MSDTLYWIWLSISLDYGTRALKKLLSVYGDAKAIFDADADELEEIEGVTKREKERLAVKDLTVAQQIAEHCMRGDIRILPYDDESFPALLREIDDPPVLLYLRGTVPDWNDAPCIALIGTRYMSYYGGECAFEIAYDLARMGCITVSGLALGVDGVCAASTLQTNGITVAVLGSGLDVIYPAEHTYLYECIIRNGGAVISEYAPNERPEKYHFPIRNRIISGLARAAIVVEGEAGSGSLITARLAASQERQVFAVPGQIGNENSEGPLLLLKHRKAAPLTCADDIYDSFKNDYLPYMNAFKLLEERDSSLEKVMQKYHVVCAKKKKKTPLSLQQDAKKIQELETHRKNAPGYKKNVSPKQLIKKIGSFLTEEKHEESEEQLHEKALKEIREKEFLMMQRMNETEMKIYKQIPYGEEVSADAIVLDDYSVTEILSILSEMELNGFVSSGCGGKFLKNIE